MAAVFYTIIMLPLRAAFYWEYYRDLGHHHNVFQQLKVRLSVHLFQHKTPLAWACTVDNLTILNRQVYSAFNLACLSHGRLEITFRVHSLGSGNAWAEAFLRFFVANDFKPLPAEIHVYVPYGHGQVVRLGAWDLPYATFDDCQGFARTWTKRAHNVVNSGGLLGPCFRPLATPSPRETALAVYAGTAQSSMTKHQQYCIK